MQADAYLYCAVGLQGYHWVQTGTGPGSCRQCSGLALPPNHVSVRCTTDKKEGDCCYGCKAGYMEKPLPGNRTDHEVCVRRCGANRYWSVAEDSCQHCARGYYSRLGDKTACALCPHNRWSKPPTIGCTDCGSLARVNAALDGCVRCDPYQYVLGDSCVPCGRGTYFARLDGARALFGCLNCSAGFYRADDATHACTPCPSGQYQPAPRASSCLRCAQGTFPDAQHVRCLPCAYNLSLLPHAQYSEGCTLQCNASVAWATGASAETPEGCQPCDTVALTVGHYQAPGHCNLLLPCTNKPQNQTVYTSGARLPSQKCNWTCREGYTLQDEEACVACANSTFNASLHQWTGGACAFECLPGRYKPSNCTKPCVPFVPGRARDAPPANRSAYDVSEARCGRLPLQRLAFPLPDGDRGACGDGVLNDYEQCDDGNALVPLRLLS